jgi:erythromycin esterase-like protein
MRDFVLQLRGRRAVADALARRRLERAIGVIYRPETERISHYFQAAVPQQFDAVVHFDETEVVEPLISRPDGSPQASCRRLIRAVCE